MARKVDAFEEYLSRFPLQDYPNCRSGYGGVSGRDGTDGRNTTFALKIDNVDALDASTDQSFDAKSYCSSQSLDDKYSSFKTSSQSTSYECDEDPSASQKRKVEHFPTDIRRISRPPSHGVDEKFKNYILEETKTNPQTRGSDVESMPRRFERKEETFEFHRTYSVNCRTGSTKMRHQLWLKNLEEMNRRKNQLEKKKEEKRLRQRDRRREDLYFRARMRKTDSKEAENIDLPSIFNADGLPYYARETRSSISWKVDRSAQHDPIVLDKTGEFSTENEGKNSGKKSFHDKNRDYLLQLISKRKETEESKRLQQVEHAEKMERIRRRVIQQIEKRQSDARTNEMKSSLTEKKNLVSERVDESEPSGSYNPAPSNGGEGSTAQLDEANEKARSLKFNELIRSKAEQYLSKIQANKLKKKLEAEKADREVQKRAASLRKMLAERAEQMRSAKRDEQEDEAKESNGECAAKVLSSKELAASICRLSKRSVAYENEIDKRVSERQNFTDWKKKRGIEECTKVFVISGFYPTISQALQSRGWYLNTDKYSTHFDLRWSLHKCDCNFPNILPWQCSNHFPHTAPLTTKVGLIETMREVRFHCDFDSLRVYPRAYDLSDAEDITSFEQDYILTAMVNLLKWVLNRFKVDNLSQKAPSGEVDSPQTSSRSSLSSTSKSDGSLNEDIISGSCRNSQSVSGDVYIHTKTLNTTFTILRRKLFHSNVESGACEELLTASGTQSHFLVTKEEWNSVAPYLQDRSRFIVSKSIEAVPDIKENQSEAPSASISKGTKQAGASTSTRETRDPSIECGYAKVGSEQLAKIDSFLSAYRELNCQHTIDGEDGSNYWIIKPAAKSRGRGIECKARLDDILEFAEKPNEMRHEKWVVQKYIENPLLISSRKFDIRQWVLVTSFNPLTVFYCNKCYLRFGVDRYKSKKFSLENKYIHLVNNSIGKTSKKFKRVFYAENGEPVEGYMWSIDSFSRYLKDTVGGESDDLYQSSIKPKLKDIVLYSLKSAREKIENRKNSWEIFGYDFMIDDRLNPWLIEVNSSPACDYSTKITEQFVKEALIDAVKVTVDWREWEEGGRRGNPPDTGVWELIHRDVYVAMPISAFGVDMTVKATGIRKKSLR